MVREYDVHYNTHGRNDSSGEMGVAVLDGAPSPTARSGMTSYDALHYGRALGITQHCFFAASRPPFRFLVIVFIASD